MSIAIADEGIIDRAYLASILWPRRWLIAAVVFIFTVLFGVLGFVLKPTYRGQAILVAAGPDRGSMGSSLGSSLGSVSELASLAGFGGLSSEDAAVEEAMAVLISRQFTEEFIGKHDLIPVLFWKLWDPVSRQWKVPLEKQPTPAKAYRYFDHIRIIKRDKQNGLITLRIDWRDRSQAADWVNELVSALNAEMRARAISQAVAALVYLNRELATTTDVGTREAVNRLIESQIRKRMLANVTQEYSLRFVDRALVADADDPVSPRKLVLLTVGFMLGLIFGISGALVLYARTTSGRRVR